MTETKRTSRLVGVLAAVLLTGYALGAMLGRAEASLPTQLEAARAFCEALNRADAAATEAASTAELWARLAPSFATSPAPGAFGRFEVVQGAGIVKAGYFMCYVLSRQPDFVEDVVMVTLVEREGIWRVCGGPTGRTGGRPLD